MGARASPIKAVALTNGDVDHVAGLLSLREAQPFSLYASRRVLDALDGERDLRHFGARGGRARGTAARRGARDSTARASISASRSRPSPRRARSRSISKTPGAADFGTRAGDTLGLRIIETASGKSFFYIPGCARLDEALARRLAGAALVFFDGTLWSETEMIEQGLMGKTGSRMGHINMSGPDGSIAAFADLGVARKIFVHINNSNPVLDAASQRARRRRGRRLGNRLGRNGDRRYERNRDRRTP